MTRRGFLRGGVHGGLGLGVNLLGASVAIPSPSACGADGFGPLRPPNADGLMLPPGFRSRVVAVSSQLVGSTGHTWHRFPDGGATFATPKGGWVYVSNQEEGLGAGGVGALRFDASGDLLDAYSILTGTSRNCAGGPTPWGTWLSCEEVPDGQVYECDPMTPGSQGVVRPALGKFQHEAATVDPVDERIYMTEDQVDGLFYRFTPANYPSLVAGGVDAMEVLDPLGQGPIAPGQVRPVAWHVVPNPTRPLGGTETRYQVAAATRFNGGEGCWHDRRVVYFATKGDNRVLALDTASDTIRIVYDFATSATPALWGVDNLWGTPCGDVYVAEDGGNMEIVALTPSGGVKPIVRVTGASEEEITGPALSPDGRHLFFNSQYNPGKTYQVSGPFVSPRPRFRRSSGGLESALAAAAIAAFGALTLRGAARTPRE